MQEEDRMDRDRMQENDIPSIEDVHLSMENEQMIE
jgi:hypothetical protein